MLCHFYSGYTVESAGKLTIKEFVMLQENIVKITEMENPAPESEKPQSLHSSGFQNIVKKQPKRKR